jgi:hypothetical protein
MSWEHAAELRGQNNTHWLDVVRVADGGHNMMVDNPLGFVECAMATALAEHGHGGIQGRDQLASGHTYGALHLYRERSQPLPVGQWALAGPAQERCLVKRDNEDGTVVIEWETGGSVGNFPAYLIRNVPLVAP